MCHFCATLCRLFKHLLILFVSLFNLSLILPLDYAYNMPHCHFCATCIFIFTFILILLAMKFYVTLLLLFLATGFSLQNSTTSLTTSLTTSTTATQNSVSFTIIPFSSGIPSSSVPLSSSVTPSHSPTSPPTPVPLVSKCYSLNDTHSNHSCVMLCVREPIRLISNYTDAATNKTKNSTVTVPDPWNVTISGFCPMSISDKLDRSAISLKWSKYVVSVTFLYNKKDNGGKNMALDKWYLESVTMMKENENNYTRNVTKNDTDTIVSDIRRAYTCDKPFILELYPEQKNTTVTWLNMTQYTIQPFALNLTNFSFKFIESCEPSGIPTFVPIIVAGILAAFVLILLLLYVIGRLRLKKKGEYERLT